MTNYDNLKDKPKRFLALTGYTLEEFLALLPYFSNSFFAFVETNTLEGKPRKKRKYTPYSNSCLPTVEDKLLFILIYLRKAMTQDVLGELFGISQAVANKWIHRLLPILNSALAAAGELPFRESPPSPVAVPDEPSTAHPVAEPFHDGTERPIQRPQAAETQQAYYSGKKKPHTVKNLLIINDGCKVVLLTASFEGRIHDKRIADSTGYDLLPRGCVLYQDTGFQGFCLPGLSIIQPTKKPRGRELTASEQAANRAISSISVYNTFANADQSSV